MSIERLINRLTQYFTWLYYRHWPTWELLTIALTVLLILLLVLRSHQKAKAKRRHEHDHASIIGKKLIDHSQEQ